MPKRFTLALVAFALAGPAAAQSPPNEWLERMSSVVKTIDFEGTVIQRTNGQSRALKVVRKVVDGVVHEKLISQEGNGLVIIRQGNEVYCILPDKKSVLTEFWSDDVTLFSTLPSSEIQFGNEYDLSIVREERVAGRTALLLAIRPHDGLRYGHRIWLDRETAFPLRTELFGGDGALLEQTKFADVRLNPEISPQAFEPSFDLDEFTWYPESVKAEAVEIETDWHAADLPAGFRVVSVTDERMPESDLQYTHILYSDGLANVSVFIAEKGEDEIAGRAMVGESSNSHSVEDGAYLITAIGEVPAATVRRIASSMQQR